VLSEVGRLTPHDPGTIGNATLWLSVTWVIG